jgi:alpha-ketoglutarate-dependent taurine dioxygenase
MELFKTMAGIDLTHVAYCCTGRTSCLSRPGLIARDRASGRGTATHYLNRNWEYLRASGKSSREPLTEEQIRERPPVQHPVFLKHPITGRKAIYVNPSFVVEIDGMPEDESARTLEYLLAHVMKPKYRYTYQWTVGDVLLWDHLGTWHNAIADYGPDEHRLMKRCQVLADRIFDPEFVREHLGNARLVRVDVERCAGKSLSSVCAKDPR